MSDKVKERIEKEAEARYGPVDHNDIVSMQIRCYIAGATAERPKAWNEAIDECIKVIRNNRGIDTVEYLNISRKLESLKHKHP